MPTHVAPLTGVNVGVHNRIAMADLRELVSDLGHADVATYIASGNVLFTPESQDTVATQLARTRAAKAGASGTARNWATVTKLMTLLEV